MKDLLFHLWLALWIARSVVAFTPALHSSSRGAFKLERHFEWQPSYGNKENDDYDDWYADFDPSKFEYSNGSTDMTYSSNNDGGYRGRGRGSGSSARYERDTSRDNSNVDIEAVELLIDERAQARRNGDYDTADQLRDVLLSKHGVMIFDKERIWRSGCSASGSGQRWNPGQRRQQQGRPQQQGRYQQNRQSRPRNDFGPLGHDYFQSPDSGPIVASISEDEINEMIAERLQYKFQRKFDEADRIQSELAALGVYVHDGFKQWRADGKMFTEKSKDKSYTQSKYSEPCTDVEEIQSMIERRSNAKSSRDYETADKIRDILRDEYNVFIDDKMLQWSIGGEFGTKSKKSDALKSWTKSRSSQPIPEEVEEYITSELERRAEAKWMRNFDTADAIQKTLKEDYDVSLSDRMREWSVGGFSGNDISNNGTTDSSHSYIRRGGGNISETDEKDINILLSERIQAKKRRDFNKADAIRDELKSSYSVSIDDRNMEWRIQSDEYVMSTDKGISANLDEETMAKIQEKLVERTTCKNTGDYDTADAIREELREKYGVVIDDRVREWFVKSGSKGQYVENHNIVQQTIQSEEEEEEMVDNEDNNDEEYNDEATAKTLNELTVVELKEKLRDSGLPVSGKKAELIDRLLEAK